MENSKTKILAIISIALLIGTVGKCEFSKLQDQSQAMRLDTSSLHTMRVEMIQAQREYEKKIDSLQAQNDSLKKSVGKTKIALSAYRFKARHLESQITAMTNKPDSIDIDRDSLKLERLLTEQYVETRQAADSLCDATISSLEQIVCNQDSTIHAQDQIKTSMMNFLKEQQLLNDNLTGQVKTLGKDLKKVKRKSFALRAGVYILAGVSATLLIMQGLK